jgi:cytochrome P450
MFLSLNHGVASKLRKEHEAHFGTDLDATIGALESNPAKTNDLEYTDAVIKETLRFFPIGFTIRQAPEGISTLHWNGQDWPVKRDMMIIPVAHTSHFDPNFWVRPKEFRPERFLGDEAGDTHRFSWRPFERGPRSCVAQDLAMEELRILLLITVRWFDFETVVGLDTVARDDIMYMGLDQSIGDLAFQQVGMEAKPRHNMQMRVTLRQ